MRIHQRNIIFLTVITLPISVNTETTKQRKTQISANNPELFIFSSLFYSEPHTLANLFGFSSFSLTAIDALLFVCCFFSFLSSHFSRETTMWQSKRAKTHEYWKLSLTSWFSIGLLLSMRRGFDLDFVFFHEQAQLSV